MSRERGVTPITGHGEAPFRLRLDLSYLGTRFEGWQAQAPRSAGPCRTVQGTLEAALETLYGVRVAVHAAGRTDAGVHARGQVAHLSPPLRPAIPPEGVRRGLNALLPDDVRVLSVALAPPGFHARFSAEGKRYVYRLRRGDVLPPLEGLVESLAPRRLDLPAMREAASRLEGRRDFAPFSITGSDPATTVRTLARLSVDEDGPVVVVTAVGDGFLRGMVRRLVGTLLEAGRGHTPPEDAPLRPGPTAPARGLTLDEVLYPGPFHGKDRITGSAPGPT